MDNMKPLISPRTRHAFQDSYAHRGSLRHIEQDFNAEGVERRHEPATGTGADVRHAVVGQYYSTVDWTSGEDVRRVLNAFEAHMMRVEEMIWPECEGEVEYLKKHLTCDGFSYDKGKITAARLTIGLGIDLSRFDIDTVQVQRNMDIMNQHIESAPEVAIGAAKDMVESCHKTILKDAGVEFSGSESITQLTHKTNDALDLLPGKVSEEKKGRDAIRKVLGNLASIVQGTAELRNLYGSGHGKGQGHSGLSPRHALLVARAAATLVAFLLETAERRKKNRTNDG